MTDREIPKNKLVDSEGIWSQVLDGTRHTHRRPALFLDRDGVIVEEMHYLHRPEDARLIPHAGRVIAAANQRGIAVVMVTNQSGIGRGYYGWSDFAAVQEQILADLAADGGCVDGVYACPHHPDHGARKPNPGMLLRAESMLHLDLASSWIVGDHASDLQAGLNAGLAGGLHVLTGHGTHDQQRQTALAAATEDYKVLPADSIADVLTLVPLFQD
jgi:D-glycero-D-manno-heptose 1,7-bisphosphate phosphatase